MHPNPAMRDKAIMAEIKIAALPMDNLVEISGLRCGADGEVAIVVK